jgi:hypothetical protein
LASSSNANDDALTPSFMAGLKGSSHNADISGTIEGIITPTVRKVNDIFLDGFADRCWIDEISCAEFLRPSFFRIVGIHRNNSGSSICDTSLDNTKANAARSKDSTCCSSLNFGGFGGGPKTRRDTASKKTSFVKRRTRVDSYDRNIGNNWYSAKSEEDSLPVYCENVDVPM